MAAGGAVGPQQQQKEQDHEEVEVLEQEEYPDNAHLDNLEEFDEEDVYVMLELPAGVDAAMLESSTVTVKVCTTRGDRDRRMFITGGCSIGFRKCRPMLYVAKISSRKLQMVS